MRQALDMSEGPCGLDPEIGALVDGRLDVSVEAETWRHLRACEACRETALEWLAMRHVCLRAGAAERLGLASERAWLALSAALASEPLFAPAERSPRIVAFRRPPAPGPWGWAAAAVVVATAWALAPEVVRVAGAWHQSAPVAEIELHWRDPAAARPAAVPFGPPIRALEAGARYPSAPPRWP